MPYDPTADPGPGGARARRAQHITKKLPTAETVQQQQVFVPGPWVSFNSSRVSRACYDRNSQQLLVDWQDAGMAYIYKVPPSVWRNMRRSTSIGKFVNRVLNQYPYSPYTGAPI